MFDAVIFDMDGVLIDSEPVYFQIEKALFKDLGLEISQEFHETFVGMAMPTIWKIITDKFELNYNVESLISIHRDRIYQYFIDAENLETIPGINCLLKRLIDADIKLVVASSTNKELVKIILKKLNLFGKFLDLTGGDEVSSGKPAPDIFLLASDKLNIPAENCLVIEDSRNGVLAAKAANMKVLGYVNPNSGNQDLHLADWTVKNFDQITIDQINKIKNKENENG